MRFFKFNKKYNFNWQYALGEILLLVVGINLAIWFNNWNTDQNIDRNKAAAIEKISEEIRDNLSDAKNVFAKNIQVINAYNDYKSYYQEDTNNLIATTKELSVLQARHPRFFRVTDSAEVENGIYRYRGKTYVDFELADLSEIAWETSKAISVTNEFSYDCLYGLEGLYNLQRRVQKEIDKSSDALQRRELEPLIDIVSFANQLIEQLIDNYEEALNSVDECR
jgi:osmotically-inducible protein OsmY